MKDVVLPLRVGYFTLLNGMVVGGKTIQVFDSAPIHPASSPYIVIEGIVPISENTKDSFMAEVTVDLVVHTSFQGDYGGGKQADLIVNEILERVIPTPGKSGVSATGFNVYRAKHLRTNGEIQYQDTRTIYPKRVTIEHLVEQI